MGRGCAFWVFARYGLAVFFITVGHCAWRHFLSQGLTLALGQLLCSGRG